MGHFDVLDLTISEDSLEEGAKQVLQHIRPAWDVERVTFERFTGGISNSLLACYLTDAPDDKVLVRVNGHGTPSGLMDKREELINFDILASAGLAPPIFCAFANGLAYGYFRGNMLDVVTMREPNVQRLIAEQLARFHSVKAVHEVELGKRPPSQYREKAQNLLDAIPDEFSDPTIQRQYASRLPSKRELQRELDDVVSELSTLDMESVFCHNDLWAGNILLDRSHSQDCIHLIDYEFAFYNYAAFDIGTHFVHYAGANHEIDYSLYPASLEAQRPFLRQYLQTRADIQGAPPVTDADVYRLHLQANKCACASHLFWSLCVLVYAEYSGIQFDFIENVRTRLTEYFKRKAEFFQLKLPSI